MTAHQLYASLLARNFRLTATGDQLLVSPRGCLLQADCDAIVEHKQALLDIITGAEAGGPARIEGDALVIPCNAVRRFRWWSGGQSIVETLAELKASPAVWQRHAARRDALLTAHGNWCKGEARQVGAVWYCGECRYFAPEARQ